MKLKLKDISNNDRRNGFVSSILFLISLPVLILGVIAGDVMAVVCFIFGFICLGASFIWAAISFNEDEFNLDLLEVIEDEKETETS